MKVILIILAIIAGSNCRLFCGIEPITANWFEVFIKLDCKKILEEHHQCCTTHGWCYIDKKYKHTVCDDNYCQCVNKLAKSGVCKTHGDNFCQTVKNIGHMMYPMITKMNMMV